MPRKQEIPDHGINLTPTIMAQALVARATSRKPAYGLKITQETGLSQGAASRILSDMKSTGLAQTGELAHFLPSGRVAAPNVSTELLQQQVGEDVHLSRAVQLAELAERMDCSLGEALDRVLGLGRMALDTSEPTVPVQQPPV